MATPALTEKEKKAIKELAEEIIRKRGTFKTNDVSVHTIRKKGLDPAAFIKEELRAQGYDANIAISGVASAGATSRVIVKKVSRQKGVIIASAKQQTQPPKQGGNQQAQREKREVVIPQSVDQAIAGRDVRAMFRSQLTLLDMIWKGHKTEEAKAKLQKLQSRMEEEGVPSDLIATEKKPVQKGAIVSRTGRELTDEEVSRVYEAHSGSSVKNSLELLDEKAKGAKTESDVLRVRQELWKAKEELKKIRNSNVRNEIAHRINQIDTVLDGAENRAKQDAYFAEQRRMEEERKKQPQAGIRMPEAAPAPKRGAKKGPKEGLKEKRAFIKAVEGMGVPIEDAILMHEEAIREHEELLKTLKNPGFQSAKIYHNLSKEETERAIRVEEERLQLLTEEKEKMQEIAKFRKLKYRPPVPSLYLKKLFEKDMKAIRKSIEDKNILLGKRQEEANQLEKASKWRKRRK